MARHYETVILPARVKKPRDKAKAENSVLQVERWVLAPLRNQRFFSLAEANAAIRELVDALNSKPLTGMKDSRRGLFEQIDRPALQPLPARRYEIAERKLNATVHIDYHVNYDGHNYSVPFRLVGQKVDIRATTMTVEIFHKGRRVASHVRSNQQGRFSTAPEHRPKSHAAYAD